VEPVKQTLRKVFQSGTEGVPEITSSAEYFYKGDVDKREWRVLGGLSTGEDNLALSAHLPDGTTLNFRQQNRGTGSILETAALSLVEPVGDLITESFDADILREADVEIDGVGRESYALYIDEVEFNNKGTADVTRSTQVALTEKPPTGSTTERSTMKTVFENPRAGKRYRFRLQSHLPVVAYELQAPDGLEDQFAKAGEGRDVRIIDLERGQSIDTRQSSVLQVSPNPTHSMLTIIAATKYSGASKAQLRVVDFIGRTVFASDLNGQVLHLPVDHLPVGTYSAILTQGGVASVSAGFVIVR
jgi:hypothetical protein